MIGMCSARILGRDGRYKSVSGIAARVLFLPAAYDASLAHWLSDLSTEVAPDVSGNWPLRDEAGQPDTALT
jgi:hypothetical protein